MASRWSRVGGWGLVVFLAAWNGSAVFQPVARAQASERLFLPVLLRDRPIISGQLLGAQTLASTPGLLLLNVNPVWVSGQAISPEPWLSEDAGVHWRQPAVKPWMSEPHLPTYAQLATVLLESADGPRLVSVMTALAGPNTGWVSVVFSSADLGQTWTRYPLRTDQGCTALDILRLAVTPAVPERLYAQGICPDPDHPSLPDSYALIVSDDVGAHWRTLPPAFADQTDASVSPAPGGGVMTVDRDGRVWRTLNDGQHWEPLGASPLGGVTLSPADPDRWVSGSEEGAVLSKDSGRTWMSLNGLPCDLTVGSWELPGATPILLFSCTDRRLALTRDDGRSWEILPPLPWGDTRSQNVFADRAVPERFWLIAAGALTEGAWSLDLSTTPAWTRVLETDPLR